MTGSDTSNSPQQSEDTPRAHTCCPLLLLLCGRVVALCSPHVVCCLSCASFAKKKKNYARKKLSLQILRAYTGIGDVETLTPWMLRKPGDLPYPCPRQNKFKRLATRDTLHGSRPNLRQRDPNDRIVPTPPNVSDKSASTKRCLRRKKK